MIFDFSWESMEGEKDKSSLEAVERLKKKLFDSQQFVNGHGWCGVFLENHDQARCLNRYLEKKDRNYYSASALATFYFFLHGTPYIYQGQEIGMENTVWNSVEELADTRAKITWKEKLEQGEDGEKLLKYFNDWGRDNARTPMQWNDEENAGFTVGNPWLKVRDDYREVNVKKQWEEENSLLSYYKKLIRLRKEEAFADIMQEGGFIPLLEKEQGVIAYKRNHEDKALIVLVNLQNRKAALEPGLCRKVLGDAFGKKPLLGNYSGVEIEGGKVILQPYQALVIAAGM